MTHTDALYQAVIGPANQDYYLERFRRFDQAGKAGASWHWPAFFITFFWLLYRKMWVVAAGYVVLVFASYVVLSTVGWMVGGMGGLLALFGLHVVAVMVVPPLLANALYHRHCRKQIANTDMLAADPQARTRELFRRGGTSTAAAAVAGVLGAVGAFLFISIMAAVSLPAYQDYVVRSHVSEAEVLARATSVTVEDFYRSHQRIPASLEEAGGAPVAGSAAIRGIGVDGASGIVSVTLDAAPVAGQTLLLVPSLDASGQFSWSCTSQDIDPRHLPAACRQPR